jgi:hypothetical protein
LTTIRAEGLILLIICERYVNIVHTSITRPRPVSTAQWYSRPPRTPRSAPCIWPTGPRGGLPAGGAQRRSRIRRRGRRGTSRIPRRRQDHLHGLHRGWPGGWGDRVTAAQVRDTGAWRQFPAGYLCRRRHRGGPAWHRPPVVCEQRPGVRRGGPGYWSSAPGRRGRRRAATVPPGQSRRPFDLSTNIGSLINRRQLDRVTGYADQGSKEGADLVTGGHRVVDSGFLLEPTLFQGSNDMIAAQ